jgi:beta-glucosidase-like glycosyl hydrolase
LWGRLEDAYVAKKAQCDSSAIGAMRSITLLCLATLALAQDLPGNTTATRACHLPGHTGYDFCNVSLTIDQRVNNLISLLKPEDKAPLLTARESPLGAIPRLGLPEYDWGTNCIHGAQTRCGSKCPTSFPNPNAQGAAWNRSLWKDMAHVTGVELRALWLADLGENHQDNLPHLGLDCWSPNININRDPRWGRNLETPGEDPYLNGQYGEWHTSGLQNGEDKRYLLAIVTLKHWDAYSLEDNGNRAGGISRHNFDAKVTKQDLAGTYFPAFKQAVRGADAKVMLSHNLPPFADSISAYAISKRA